MRSIKQHVELNTLPHVNSKCKEITLHQSGAVLNTTWNLKNRCSALLHLSAGDRSKHIWANLVVFISMLCIIKFTSHIWPSTLITATSFQLLKPYTSSTEDFILLSFVLSMHVLWAYDLQCHSKWWHSIRVTWWHVRDVCFRCFMFSPRG
jgi:hypothetical protein